MSVTSIYRWHDGGLDPLEYCDMTDTAIVAADSWLVTEGTALALDLHRRRFLDAVAGGPHGGLAGVAIDGAGGAAGIGGIAGIGATAGVDGTAAVDTIDAERFWEESIALIPREGDWFPRVELQDRAGAPLLVFRLRSAPECGRSVRLATHTGNDPRTTPRVKGPDTAALLRLRTEAQALGADEAVLLSPDGYVVEGATTALLWWHGDVLSGPSPELDRVDSVTARSVLALATALGVDVYPESVTPAELDGVEIWALNALHGIRIVAGWVDGPAPAEQPGRLATWRARLDRLRKPLP